MADLDEMLSSLHDGIVNLFTDGKLSEAKNEQTRLSVLGHELETLVYKYKYLREKAKLLSKSLYQITKTAYHEVSHIRDIIPHLSVNQRSIIEHGLQNERYVLKDIEHTLDTLQSFSYGNVSHGFFADIFDNALSREIALLKAGQYEALQNIDTIKSRLFELEASMYRFDEIGMGIGKGVTAFRYCFKDFRRKLFPKGKESKLERQARVASGGLYFLENEQPEVESLVISAGFLLKMIEAQP
jgi:hypothetical protein